MVAPVKYESDTKDLTKSEISFFREIDEQSLGTPNLWTGFVYMELIVCYHDNLLTPFVGMAAAPQIPKCHPKLKLLHSP